MTNQNWDKEGVWEALEAQLDAQARKRRAIYFWILLGLGACLLLGAYVQFRAGHQIVELAPGTKAGIDSTVSPILHRSAAPQPEGVLPAAGKRQALPQGERPNSPQAQAASGPRTAAAGEALQLVPAQRFISSKPTATDQRMETPASRWPALPITPRQLSPLQLPKAAVPSAGQPVAGLERLPSLPVQPLVVFWPLDMPLNYDGTAERVASKGAASGTALFVEAGAAQLRVHFIGTDSYVARREASERPSFAWQHSLGVQHQLGAHLSIWAALRYEELFSVYEYRSVQAQAIALPGEIVYPLPNGANFTEAIEVSATVTQSRYIVRNNRLRRLQLPLGLSCTLGDERHRALLRLGLRLRLFQELDGVLLGASGQHVFEPIELASINDGRRIALGGQLQLGYVYALSSRWQLQALADYAQDGGQQVSGEGFARFSSLGFTIGLSHLLR